MAWIGAHELGDCEKFDGYLCEECRIWYMEQELEWEEAERYREENEYNAEQELS